MISSSITHMSSLKTASERCKSSRNWWSTSTNMQTSSLRWLTHASKSHRVSWRSLSCTEMAKPNLTSSRTLNTSSSSCYHASSRHPARRLSDSVSLSATTLSNQKCNWWRPDWKMLTIWSRWRIHLCSSNLPSHSQTHTRVIKLPQCILKTLKTA